MLNLNMFKIFVIFLVFVTTAAHDSDESCIVPKTDGTCPDFSCCIDKNIVLSYEKVQGILYQYVLNPYYFGTEYKCGFYNFTQPNANTFKFEVEEWHNITEVYRKTHGHITYEPSGKIFLKYTDIELPINFKTILLRDDIWCVMECNEAGFLTKQGAGTYFYCATRQRRPSSKQIKIIKKKLKYCGVSLDNLYYPNRHCGCRDD